MIFYGILQNKNYCRENFMEKFLCPILCLMILAAGGCNKNEKSQDLSSVNPAGFKTNGTIPQNTNSQTQYEVNNELKIFTAAEEGYEPRQWTLKEVKNYCFNNKTGEVKDPDLGHKLYFGEGDGFSGLGFHVNSYKYLNIYYMNIL
jgi:hypothetical protein